MKYKYVIMFLVSCLAAQARAEFTFYESFDGYKEGSKAKDNIANTATAPVLWSDEAYTSIRNVKLLKGYVGLENIADIKNPKITNNSIPRSATESSALLFTYKAGPNSWSEQRFKLNPAFLGGEKGLKEIWVQYDIFIPRNYKIIDDNPTSTNYFGAGHKVFTLYADAYSAPNSTFILGGVIARRDSAGKIITEDHVDVYQMSTLSTYKNGERIFTQLGIDEEKRELRWVDSTKDLGRWQRRTMHFKFPTSETSNDGVIEFWIRRQDTNVMKLFEKLNGNFYGYSQNYFNAGYINGFYNAGFPEETFLVVDNVIISDSKAAIDEEAITVTKKMSPPTDTKLQ